MAEKSLVLVGFTEAEGRPIAEALLAKSPGSKVVVVCEREPFPTIEETLKSLLLKMPNDRFHEMFRGVSKKRTRKSTKSK